jgi:hypothetical protein
MSSIMPHRKKAEHNSHLFQTFNNYFIGLHAALVGAASSITNIYLFKYL